MGKYYIINNETFTIEEKDQSEKVINLCSFDKPKTAKQREELKPKEKVSPVIIGT